MFVVVDVFQGWQVDPTLPLARWGRQGGGIQPRKDPGQGPQSGRRVHCQQRLQLPPVPPQFPLPFPVNFWLWAFHFPSPETTVVGCQIPGPVRARGWYLEAIPLYLPSAFRYHATTSPAPCILRTQCAPSPCTPAACMPVSRLLWRSPVYFEGPAKTTLADYHTSVESPSSKFQVSPFCLSKSLASRDFLLDSIPLPRVVGPISPLVGKSTS